MAPSRLHLRGPHLADLKDNSSGHPLHPEMGAVRPRPNYIPPGAELSAKSRVHWTGLIPRRVHNPYLEKKGLLPLSSSKLTPTAYLPGDPGPQGPESTSLALQHWVHVGPCESQVPPLQQTAGPVWCGLLKAPWKLPSTRPLSPNLVSLIVNFPSPTLMLASASSSAISSEP